MVAFINFIAVVAMFLCFDLCNNIRVIPERVYVDKFNKSYVDDVKVYIKRYGRKSDYYINAEGTIKKTLGDNIRVQIDLYEYLHNEYRPTFIQFHFKRGCEFVNNDPYMGKALKTALNRSGLACPVQPGHYKVENMTLVYDDFPYLWPFQRAMAVSTSMSGKDFVGNGTAYIRFEQKKKH